MKIENHSLNIDESFKNFHYIVPEYQREYIWQESNVQQLLDDIREEYEKDHTSEYFIGSIVVTKSKNSEEHEVIDGQQRLTTLFLTLCAFKRIFKNLNETEHENILQQLICATRTNTEGEIVKEPHLKLQYENTSQLLEQILEGKNIADEFFGATKNIQMAYEVASDYLRNNFEEPATLKRFYGYFINKVRFIQIETPSISDALKIFETINERGIGLNPMDLLKNLIFQQIEQKKFSRVNSEWKKITDLLEKNKQKPLRFLRYFLLANYQVKDSKGRPGIYEDEIYDWITKNDDQCHYTSKPFEFIQKIIQNAEAYIHLTRGENSKGEIVPALQNIYALGGDRYSLHLILLLASQNLSTENFRYLTEQLEVLIFAYIIGGGSAKELERNFTKWSGEIRNMSTGEGVQNDSLRNFVEQKFIPEVSQLQEQIQANFLKANWNSFPKYRLKYILSKLSQYVDTGLSPKQKTLEAYESGEIEHILPNTPNSELIQSFNDDAEEYGRYKLMLGNLTLLEKIPNIVAGRNFFQEKLRAYRTSNFYLTRSIAEKTNLGGGNAHTKMNEKLLSFSEWGKDQIEQRQEMLMNLARDIWRIKILDNSN